MRFLTTYGRESSALEFSADVMRSVAVVCDFNSQLRGDLRQLEIGRAHYFQNCRPHELQKRHERRHGISGKPKHEAFANVAKQKWLSRFNRHAPDFDFRSELA